MSDINEVLSSIMRENPDDLLTMALMAVVGGLNTTADKIGALRAKRAYDKYIASLDPNEKGYHYKKYIESRKILAAGLIESGFVRD